MTTKALHSLAQLPLQPHLGPFCLLLTHHFRFLKTADSFPDQEVFARDTSFSYAPKSQGQAWTAAACGDALIYLHKDTQHAPLLCVLFPLSRRSFPQLLFLLEVYTLMSVAQRAFPDSLVLFLSWV